MIFANFLLVHRLPGRAGIPQHLNAVLLMPMHIQTVCLCSEMSCISLHATLLQSL